MQVSHEHMRPLWPIERAVLDAAAQDYPASTEALQRQAETAQVVHFENTGAGFFSTVSVGPEAPLLAGRSPLDAATGSVDGIENGMSFLVFFENGQLSLIEGYCNGGASTAGTNFADVQFCITPWSAAGR